MPLPCLTPDTCVFTPGRWSNKPWQPQAPLKLGDCGTLPSQSLPNSGMSRPCPPPSLGEQEGVGSGPLRTGATGRCSLLRPQNGNRFPTALGIRIPTLVAKRRGLSITAAPEWGLRGGAQPLPQVLLEAVTPSAPPAPTLIKATSLMLRHSLK